MVLHGIIVTVENVGQLPVMEQQQQQQLPTGGGGMAKTVFRPDAAAPRRPTSAAVVHKSREARVKQVTEKCAHY